MCSSTFDTEGNCTIYAEAILSSMFKNVLVNEH
jgi:hypothetical protein